MCASSIRTARFAPRALAPGLASFAPRACAPGLASAGRRSRRSADTQFDGCTAGGRAGQPGWQGGSQLGQAVHTAHVRAITGQVGFRGPTAGMPTCRAAQPTSVMWACRPSAPGRARHAHARPVLRSPRHVRAERDLDGGGVDAVDRWSGGLFQGQIEDVGGAEVLFHVIVPGSTWRRYCDTSLYHRAGSCLCRVPLSDPRTSTTPADVDIDISSLWWRERQRSALCTACCSWPGLP